jgi:hypothetical protein
MGKMRDALDPALIEFIGRQQLFFVASAPDEGRINLSPKGLDCLRVLDDRTVAYLDLTGSGAETAAHVRANGRLTMMFCSFAAEPLILRLYGRGELVRPGEPAWTALAARFPVQPSARQIILLHVQSVQTSCGYGVPLFDFSGQRTGLVEWAEKKGADGLAAYRRDRNRLSIDGLPTGLGEADGDIIPPAPL